MCVDGKGAETRGALAEGRLEGKGEGHVCGGHSWVAGMKVGWLSLWKNRLRDAKSFEEFLPSRMDLFDATTWC